MKMLQITWKQIKHDFRDIKTFVFMVAFPIVLMLVLGSALSGAFDSEKTIGDVHVLYTSTADEQTTNAFKDFVKATGKSGIHFKEADSKSAAEKQIEDGKKDAFLQVRTDGMQLEINKSDSLEASILQGTLAAFVKQYNLGSVIAKEVPEKQASLFANKEKEDFIKEKTITGDKQPGSMDYYAIVMTTMIALYAAISASFLITAERTRHTADRLMIAPVKKSNIFAGKVLGSIVINAVCIAAVVIVSIVALHANWGSHPGLVSLLLLSEIIFAISFGLGISYMTKTPAAARVIIMTVVQVASFFGGAYFKIDNPEGFMKILTNLSPLTWENDAVIKMVYANDLSALFPAIGFNIGAALLFMLIASVIFRKKEGM
ncbi:ABC transporter permease [Virgibacillus halophilus]